MKSFSLMSEIEPQSAISLWHPWIVLGEIAIIDGDPGTNKSSMILDLAARISVGAMMPEAGKAVSATGCGEQNYELDRYEGLPLDPSQQGLEAGRLDPPEKEWEKARGAKDRGAQRCPAQPGGLATSVDDPKTQQRLGRCGSP